jgi:hypothetical protein
VDPPDVLERVLDVVQEDLADAGASLGLLGAEVGHPPVVGLDPGVAQLVLVGGGGLCEQHEVREERGNRVREDDLGHDAVAVLVAVASLGVPVADAVVGVLQVLERVLVLGPPLVEGRLVPVVEVLAVLGVAPAGMGVTGDHHVVVVGSEHQFPLRE